MMGSLKDACDKLRMVDLKATVSDSTDCSEDDVVAWLVSKFGFYNVFQRYSQLPNPIIDSQKD